MNFNPGLPELEYIEPNDNVIAIRQNGNGHDVRVQHETGMLWRAVYASAAYIMPVDYWCCHEDAHGGLFLVDA